MTWPPCDAQVYAIALRAYLSRFDDTVALVYWEQNPSVIIFDPETFAETDYVEHLFRVGPALVKVIVGRSCETHLLDT
tara:strand:+ start:142 stop:375 length:234 start_codon:yes stop_codon:yes gene_type:complete